MWHSASKKAQAGTEYLIVVAIGLLLLTPVIVLGQRSISDFNASSDQILARQALNKIEEASKLVYAQGAPAKITINARMPGNIVSTSIQGSMLVISLRNAGQVSDLISILNFPINGTIPSSSGSKRISTEAKMNSTGDVYVEISSG